VLSESELAAIVGRALPGGEYTITVHSNWIASDAVEGPPPGEFAHPLFVYLAAARGKGMTWDEVFAVCGATADDGPMFGEHETEVRRPLRVGETVTLAGEFTSALRKRGRKAGVFDVIAFELRLTGADGEVAAVTRNSIVYPRRDA
jgi:hypothetical protein